MMIFLKFIFLFFFAKTTPQKHFWIEIENSKNVVQNKTFVAFRKFFYYFTRLELYYLLIVLIFLVLTNKSQKIKNSFSKCTHCYPIFYSSFFADKCATKTIFFISDKTQQTKKCSHLERKKLISLKLASFLTGYPYWDTITRT